VHVATRVVNGGAAIAAEGFVLHPLAWRRGSTNLFDFMSAVAEVRRVYRALKPDLVHQVAFWPSVVGSLAAAGLGITRLSALAGMGFAFTSNAPKARIVRGLLRPFFRHLLGGPHGAVLVQNPDDYAEMISFGMARERVFVIPGSGVDTDMLRALPEPPPPIAIGYVGRLLDDKGLRSLVAAHALLAARGETIRLLIAGETDPANPASIPQSEIETWRKEPTIEVLGHVPDIASVWAKAHIAVLPSRREGLPKSLLEAAACGRPIVATDVQGCREIARHGLNALLVPVDDPPALAEAISRLAQDADLRRKFGTAGRTLVEREFSGARIGAEIVNLYRAMLSSDDAPQPARNT
jgi:glycosyltransferase involved in cell wall biosynthesis